MTFHFIRSGQYEFPKPEWTNVSSDAKDLIKVILIWQSNDLILGDNDNDSVDNNVTIKSDIGENYQFLQSLTNIPCQGCLKTNPEERLSIDQVIQNKWVSVSLQKNPQWWNVQVPPHFYSLESLSWTKRVPFKCRRSNSQDLQNGLKLTTCRNTMHDSTNILLYFQ